MTNFIFMGYFQMQYSEAWKAPSSVNNFLEGRNLDGTFDNSSNYL